MEVLASSMQRIAGCLEEILCERSPARNATAHQQQLRQSPSMRTSGGAAASASAAVPPDMHSPQQAPVSSDTSNLASGAYATAGGQLQKAPWSPAAHAAKARMLASTARSPARRPTAESRYQQQQPQGASTEPQEAQQQLLCEATNRRDGTAELGGAQAAAAAGAGVIQGDTAAAGWLHPSSLQDMPAAAASAAAPSTQHNEQHIYAANGAAEVIAAAPASPRNTASLQALASRAAGSTVLGRGPAAANESKNGSQQQQVVSAGWQAEPSLVDMPGGPGSPRVQGSPSSRNQQQARLMSAALHTANVQAGGLPASEQQSQHRMRHWHLDDLSCSEAEYEWQEEAEQEQFSFPVQLPSLHHAALQLGPPPRGMRSSKGGASARCIVAAADVKLLQAERGEQNILK
jgi:hypothetical protein